MTALSPVRSATRWIILIGAVAVLISAGVFLPIAEWSRAGIAAAHDAGWKGAVAYGAAYVLATILGLPALPLTLGAGFLYGPLRGVLLISPASLLGATGAFLISRGLARRRVEAWLAHRPAFQAIDAAARERPFSTVLLLRLSPLLPFNVLNYALGLSPVPLRTYVLASFVGMLPATIAFVWLGSLAPDLAGLSADAGPRGPRLALLVVGVMATLAVTLALGRVARREFARRGSE